MKLLFLQALIGSLGFARATNFIQGSDFVPPYTDEDNRLDGQWVDKVSVSPRPEKCLALALSDSLNVGPYQAGVIRELVKKLRASGDSEYQVISGVSLGAINAHIFAQYPRGQELEAAEKVVDFWLKLSEKNNQLIRSWNWGILYGFFYQNSLYDATALYNFIEDYFAGTTLKKHVNLGNTNLLNGQFHSFKEHHSSDELVQVMKASLAFPGVFKAVEAFDSLWITGSSVYEIDVIQPINHCRDLGYSDKDIVVDVILIGNPHLHHVLAKIYNAFAIAARTFEVQKYYERMFGLLRAKGGHPDVNFRHVIGPQREMANKVVPVEMTRSEALHQIKLGAKDVIQYFAQQSDKEPTDTHTYV